MKTLMRAQEIIGLPVVTVDGGDDVAEIRDVVYDGTEHRLVGFTLNGRGFFAGRLGETLLMSDVTAIGRDAVMVREEASLTEAATTVTDPSSPVRVVGVTVVSADGSELGEVSEVILAIDGEPSVVGYEVTGGDDQAVFIPITAQLALSDEQMIAPADATDFIRNDLAGFGAAVEQYRSATLERSQ